jgi:hypothetical protein
LGAGIDFSGCVVERGSSSSRIGRNDVEHGTLLTVATFDELREQAKQEISGQPRPLAEDTDGVEQAADLLAALRLWANTQQRTDADVREAVDLASGTTLKNIATELEEGGGDDALEASRRLEGIAYSPSERLSEIFEFAQRAFPPSSPSRPLWDVDQQL